jgi:hypothetical protein
MSSTELKRPQSSSLGFGLEGSVYESLEPERTRLLTHCRRVTRERLVGGGEAGGETGGV